MDLNPGQAFRRRATRPGKYAKNKKGGESFLLLSNMAAIPAFLFFPKKTKPRSRNYTTI
jgi:hypothetical protein